jgi:hypothetical protein
VAHFYLTTSCCNGTHHFGPLYNVDGCIVGRGGGGGEAVLQIFYPQTIDKEGISKQLVDVQNGNL